MPLATQRGPETEEPIFWFATLELAVERGDLRRAAEAVDALREMGIEVKYRRLGRQPARRKPEVANGC